MVYTQRMKTRLNTYFDSDVMSIIRAEQKKRFPESKLTFSTTVNQLIREWNFWSEFRRQQERHIANKVQDAAQR